MKMAATAINISHLSFPKDRSIETHINSHFLMSTAVILSKYDVNPDGPIIGEWCHQWYLTPPSIH